MTTQIRAAGWTHKEAVPGRRAASSWRRALRMAVANAVIFFLLSLAFMLFDQTGGVWMPIAASGIFFIGSVASFVALIRAGGTFAAIAWYVFGSGVYFGLGVFIGGVAPDDRSIHFVSELALYEDLLRINVMNGGSVLLVLATAMFVCYSTEGGARREIEDRDEMTHALMRLFPAMMVLASMALILQLLFFPVADEYLTRTFLSTFYFVIPFAFLALGMLWPRLPPRWLGVGIVVFCAAFLVALLSFSKFSIIALLLVVVAGNWVHHRKLSSVLIGMIILAAAYSFFGELMMQGRVNPEYDAIKNTPATRLKILFEELAGGGRAGDSGSGGPNEGDSVPDTLARFVVSDIQGYLISEYDQGRPGTSLDDLWVAAIPRILWRDKPNVTRFGAELHELYWRTPEATSAIAPTYDGEAYWNWGPAGVVFISILIGFEVGLLTRGWHLAAKGKDPAFYLIAFPVALWASFVENWVAASYVGGFLTLLILWMGARILVFKVRQGTSLQRFWKR